MTTPDESSATLLIIEDSDVLRRSLCSVTQKMELFEHVLTAGDGLEGYRVLRQEKVDIVLCDLQMPRCDGLGFLRLQQRDPRTARVPVLVLTASEDFDSRVKALQSGASDFVTKPAHVDEMRARLSVHLKLKQLHDALEQKNAALERMTRTDGLTGVANRRYFDEALLRECARAKRYGRPVSLLLADIDHFKQLNDRYGHPAGDAVLRAVGGALNSLVRGSDTVARYGGEEFAVLLPETSCERAAMAGERVRSAVADLRIDWPEGPLTVTASIGVSELDPSNPTEPAALVASADEALYNAKRSGRDRVVVATSDEQQALSAR